MAAITAQRNHSSYDQSHAIQVETPRVTKRSPCFFFVVRTHQKWICYTHSFIRWVTLKKGWGKKQKGSPHKIAVYGIIQSYVIHVIRIIAVNYIVYA